MEKLLYSAHLKCAGLGHAGWSPATPTNIIKESVCKKYMGLILEKMVLFVQGSVLVKFTTNPPA